VSIAEKPVVVHPDSMDAEAFHKHMNNRHRDSLGGLSSISFKSDYLTLCWRNFHRRLHALRPDLTHDHGEYRP
jgi:hypothetical protein